jgi:hypothetical protein
MAISRKRAPLIVVCNPGFMTNKLIVTIRKPNTFSLIAKRYFFGLPTKEKVHVYFFINEEQACPIIGQPPDWQRNKYRIDRR